MLSGKVIWSSQSQGSWIEKIGEVVLFVPKGKKPSELYNFRGISKKDMLFNPDSSSPSDRYVVKVAKTMKRGPDKELYYSPRASWVNQYIESVDDAS